MILEEEIKKAIEATLPTQVGNALREKLEQADRDAASLKKYIASCEDKNNKIVALEAKIEEYRKLDHRNDILNERQAALDKLEMEYKLRVAEYKLNAEMEKSEFAKSVALGLVRNAEYRESVYNTKFIPGNQHNNWQNTTESDTQTRERSQS